MKTAEQWAAELGIPVEHARAIQGDALEGAARIADRQADRWLRNGANDYERGVIAGLRSFATIIRDRKPEPRA